RAPLALHSFPTRRSSDLFEVRGDRDMARRVAEGTRLFRLAAGFGGVESLIAHPLTMTHASQVGLWIAPSERLLRLSVGIEAEARSEEHTSELQSRGHLVC